MKYSEFGRKLSFLGFQLDEDDKIIIVSKRDGTDVASVSITEEFAVDFVFNGFYSLRRDQKKDLVDLCYQLASTPLDEREDEKRYRLRLPFIENGMGYLNEFQSNDIFIGDKHHVYEHKTIFTESEIEELKEKYNLDSFVLEDVKDDE